MANFRMSNAKLYINNRYIDVMQVNGDVDILTESNFSQFQSWLYESAQTVGNYISLELFMANWGQYHKNDVIYFDDPFNTNILVEKEFLLYPDSYSGNPYTVFRKGELINSGLYYGYYSPTSSTATGRGYNYPLIYIWETDTGNELTYCFIQSYFTNIQINSDLRYWAINIASSRLIYARAIRNDYYGDHDVRRDFYNSSISNWRPAHLSASYKPVADDPFTDGGISAPSGTTGPGGVGPGTSSGGGYGDALFKDTVPIPELPTVSAVDTGFITIFNPTLSELNALSTFMWSDLFSLDTLKKLFENPMDFILGLSLIPAPIPSGGRSEVTVGNIVTTVYMTKAATQWITVDCGGFEIPHYWNAYLDYSPYTKLQIYLPYIGYRSISIDEFVGKTISVQYKVDILTGSCTAFIASNGNVLYQFSGQCAISIPITGRDFTQMIQTAVTLMATSATTIPSLASLPMSSNASTAVSALSGIGSSVKALTSLKPDIVRSGNIGGSCGLMSVQNPYIIITRPSQCLPESQNHFTGYPSYVTTQLASLTGFTIVDEIHLEGIGCTDDELSEIEMLLREGVLI